MFFEKVSYAQFQKDFKDCFPNDNEEQAYNTVTIPRRATACSAGYDFVSPVDFYLLPDQPVKIPTGIRIILPEDAFLMCVPRSGLGFKYGLSLMNTVGIIDADYFNSPNEGHIFAKLKTDYPVLIQAGEAFMQGIILPYYKTDSDDTTSVRTGGFGSTSKK